MSETTTARNHPSEPAAVLVRRGETIHDVASARGLFRQYAESLPFSLAYQGFEAELAGLPAPYVPPHGVLLVATRGVDTLGTVGLKRLGPGIAEIKRLFIVPEARGHGIGKILFARIVEEARAKRYERVRLDSHRSSMSAAIGLYRGFGFAEIPPYGPDLGGNLVFFEKWLVG